jgi:hypothetical protein
MQLEERIVAGVVTMALMRACVLVLNFDTPVILTSCQYDGGLISISKALKYPYF